MPPKSKNAKPKKKTAKTKKPNNTGKWSPEMGAAVVAGASAVLLTSVVPFACGMSQACMQMKERITKTVQSMADTLKTQRSSRNINALKALPAVPTVWYDRFPKATGN
jgi:uncharacterized protein HemX